MTIIMSEDLPLNSKYIKMGREERGCQAFLTQPPRKIVCYAVRNHLTASDFTICNIHIRFEWIVGTLHCGSFYTVNSQPEFQPSPGVPSEVCDSRRWLKFRLVHSPLFSSTWLMMAIASVKVISNIHVFWVSAPYPNHQ